MERDCDEGSAVTTQHTHVLPPGTPGVLGSGLGCDGRRSDEAETVTKRNSLTSGARHSHYSADAFSSVLLGLSGSYMHPILLIL